MSGLYRFRVQPCHQYEESLGLCKFFNTTQWSRNPKKYLEADYSPGHELYDQSIEAGHFFLSSLCMSVYVYPFFSIFSFLLCVCFPLFSLFTFLFLISHLCSHLAISIIYLLLHFFYTINLSACSFAQLLFPLVLNI